MIGDIFAILDILVGSDTVGWCRCTMKNSGTIAVSLNNVVIGGRTTISYDRPALNKLSTSCRLRATCSDGRCTRRMTQLVHDAFHYYTDLIANNSLEPEVSRRLVAC